MFSKTMKRSSAAFLSGLMLFASGAAIAGDVFDGKSNFICAAQGVMACVDVSICSRGEARDFEMPDFMLVDIKAKVIRASYDEGKEANSAIKNMETSGNQLILQGVENDHGWSLAVHRESGRMSVGVAGHDVSFTIFGACKVL